MFKQEVYLQTENNFVGLKISNNSNEVVGSLESINTNDLLEKVVNENGEINIVTT